MAPSYRFHLTLFLPLFCLYRLIIYIHRLPVAWTRPNFTLILRMKAASLTFVIQTGLNAPSVDTVLASSNCTYIVAFILFQRITLMVLYARVEPRLNRFCIRCCASANDQSNCNSHQDRLGCMTAIPGTYDFPDLGISCTQ